MAGTAGSASPAGHSANKRVGDGSEQDLLDHGHLAIRERYEQGKKGGESERVSLKGMRRVELVQRKRSNCL